jgi:uncharacterized protein (TIGR02147 family)
MPDIFAYTDFRKYLADYYKDKKARSAAYSYQIMADKMGFKARDFIFRVIQGDKKLSAASVAKISLGLGHSVEESRYFMSLICFNQAGTAQEKEFYYQQMNLKTGKAGMKKDVLRLSQDRLELFSEWYHLAIRSLIEMSSFSDDYAWLANQLVPKISKKQARSSIQHLEKLGLITKDAKSVYRITEKGVATDDEVTSLSVVRFYLACLRLTSEAIRKLPKDLRNVSGVTLGISRETYGEIVEEINRFRKKIGQMARNDNHPSDVYQMQIALFPFSDPNRERREV